MEAHRIRGGKGYEFAPEPVPTSHASPFKPTEGAEPLPKQPLDFLPGRLNSGWFSYGAVNGTVAPEQLSLMQDLSLTELKTSVPPEPDAEMPDAKGKAALSVVSPEDSTCSRDGDDEQASSDDPTPASEACEYWEESPELNACNIDDEVLLEALKGPLDTLFREWLGSNRCHAGGEANDSSPSSSSSARSSGQQPKSKRKRVDDSVDNGDNEKRPNKLRVTEKRSRKLMPLHKLLACPYFKKDSRHHRACCGFGFKKLSYMKTHIYQKHAIPIYCPVCQRSFDNVQRRDGHSRERRCEPVENVPAPDGITSEQRDWLHQRGPRNLTEEKQWFRVFKFLFPDYPQPHSPYNDTAFSEDLLNFRDYLGEPAAQEVLFQRVRENVFWNPDLEAMVRADLVYGLDQLYWSWAATVHSRTGHVLDIESPSQGPGLPNQSTAEDVSSPGIQSEARGGEQRGASGAELTTHQVSQDTASATVNDLDKDAEAPDDFELEERKVDESDQMPPRQLNHEGIAPIPQAQWQPADFSGRDDIYHESLDLSVSNDINHGHFEMDLEYSYLNLPDGIGAADLEMASFDLFGNEDLLSWEDPQRLSADRPLLDLEMVFAGDTASVVDTRKKTDLKDSEDSEESDGFTMVPKSR